MSTPSVPKNLRNSAGAHFWRGNRTKIVIALILTFASGLVDVVGYVGIYHLFSAHVTGTTVHLGKSMVEGNGIEIVAAFSVLLAFFVGSVLGRTIIEIGARKRLRSIASVTIAIETAMLVFVAQVTSHPFGNLLRTAPYLLLVFLAAAMGIQTATLTGIGPLTVHTTFVTGMVNKLAQLVSHLMFRAYDRFRSS